MLPGLIRVHPRHPWLNIPRIVERNGVCGGIAWVESFIAAKGRTERKENQVMANDGEEFIPTRRSLLLRLKNWGDQQSWQDFFDTYWRLIYSVALKAGLSDAEAQDVVQETVLTVARKVGDFKSDPALGSFKGWLLLITRRRIADQFATRAKPGQASRLSTGDAGRETGGTPALVSDDATRTATVERIPDPASFDLDACWEEQWQRNLLDAATARVKNLVSPKQYQLFELSVLREWPVRKVATTLDVNVGQVYLARHRIGSLLKKELKKLQKDADD
jgi:RNA polymerase sigma-70 factor (ECF subfamily)